MRAHGSALLLCLTFASATTSGASWAAPLKPEGRAAALQALATCRKETDGPKRLSCYDLAAAALDEAEAKGQVVVLDREQVRTVRRQAFGLELPAFALFRGRGGAAAPADEPFDRMAYTLASAQATGDGKWVMNTTDEQTTWVQTDDEPINRAPRAGSKLAVRRAAMGSYFCNVDGQRAVRCVRRH